jgi:hypothetical protein
MFVVSELSSAASHHVQCDVSMPSLVAIRWATIAKVSIVTIDT